MAITPSKRCCRTCEITKDIEEFDLSRNIKYPNSRRHRCKECEKLMTKKRNRINYLKRKMIELRNEKTEADKDFENNAKKIDSIIKTGELDIKYDIDLSKKFLKKIKQVEVESTDESDTYPEEEKIVEIIED